MMTTSAPTYRPTIPTWRIRALMEAMRWARERRIPYSPWLAAKVL